MSIESMILSKHLVLCDPILPLLSIFPRISVFSCESALCIRCPKHLSFIFSISPSNEYSWLVSCRIGCKTCVKHLLRNWCWSWNSNTLASWCEELTHLKRPWCWERFRAEVKGDDRGWVSWMSSLTQWTWVWVNSRSLWLDREAWCAVVHGVAKSWTWLSNWTELN